MDLRRISPALTEDQKLSVVSVQEVKVQARVYNDDEDGLIASFIGAAYDYLTGPEGWLNHMALLPEQYEFYTDGPGHFGIELPMRPFLQDGSHPVEFAFSESSAYSVVGPSGYMVWRTPSFARVNIGMGTRWPYSGQYNQQAYRSRFWAGYPTVDDIPQSIKHAIRLIACHYYANREAVGADGRAPGQAIELGVRNLCGRYKLALDHS